MEFKIYTSYFGNLKKIGPNVVPISIARQSPVWYTGLKFKTLAPKPELFHAKLNQRDYTRAFKFQLKALDARQVGNQLWALAGNAKGEEAKSVVLLCHEKPEKFCHRQLVAVWLQDQLGVLVEEYPNHKKPADPAQLEMFKP